MLEAVRYAPDGRTLEVVRGYSRQGAVWSDLRLFTRQELLERIRSGGRVVTGRVADLEGDFAVLARVRVGEAADGGAVLRVEGEASDRDDLGLPWF